VGTSGAGFFVRFGDVDLVVVVVLRLLVVLRRRRPGMDLPLVPRHGRRRHRRIV
jgi:hypothetical protein